MKKKRQWFMCLGMIGVFTASVILSVFGQRKVKAQLNTENAGKITSSWADEKHIFSSFDDEKALSVDASYGFKKQERKQQNYQRSRCRISLKSIHGFRLHKIPQGILRSEKQIWRSINAKPMEVMAIGKN